MTNNRFEMGLLLHVVEMIRKQWSLNGLLNIGVLIPGLLDDAAELVLGDTLMGDLGGGVSDLGQVGGYTAHNRVEALLSARNTGKRNYSETESSHI